MLEKSTWGHRVLQGALCVMVHFSLESTRSVYPALCDLPLRKAERVSENMNEKNASNYEVGSERRLYFC